MKTDQTKRKKIGEMLVEQGLLLEENLKQALEVQQESGGLLGEILVRHGWASSEDIARALIQQLANPFLRLDAYNINEEAFHMIPAELCKRWNCLAVDRNERIITIVAQDPSIEPMKQAITEAQTLEAQFYIGLGEEIQATIEKFSKKIPVNPPQTVQEGSDDESAS